MSPRDRWNGCRWRRDGRGHYESWFARANDALGERAFWIRYTIFEPAGRPQDAVAERWAIYFDRSAREITAVKDIVDPSECVFDPDRLDVTIADSTLTDTTMHGRAATEDHAIGWELDYTGGQAPLLLFPERLYSTLLPKAKALVGRPHAIFTGTLTVDGSTIHIEDWIGSHNHNWGSKHTDHYAWGQVVGFDEEPEAFLECATARLKIGPLWTPRISPLVLRLPDREIALNGLGTAVRARGRFRPFEWSIETGDRRVRVEMRMHGARDEFVALRYGNPPGGTKTCLNSKIAHCELRLETTGEPARTLTSSRAAFEILTDDDDHGLVPVV